MFGKSANAITDYLISEDTFNPEHCVSLLQRSLKKKADSVLASIEGYSITSEQKLCMRIVRSHLDYIESAIVYHSRRRGKKRAIIAIARMILTAIHQMMITDEVWNPTDLFKIDMPEALKEKQLVKAVKQATTFLKKQRLSVAS